MYLVSIFQVINDRFGIVEGLMTTVHSITGRFVSWLAHLLFRSLIHVFILLSFWYSLIQLLRKLLMGHLARTGEAEELLHSTSFLAVQVLLR
jgi:hypothetical protein